MKPSTFILSKNNDLPVVSFAVIERFYTALSDIPDCSPESALTIAYRDTFRDWSAPIFDTDWYEKPIAQIQEVTKGSEEVAAGNSSLLLGSLSGFLGGLDIDVTLVAMCGYNYETAEYLYTYVDCQFVKKLLSCWAKLQMETARAGYESALYASGGKLAGDSRAVQGKPVNSVEDAKRMGMPVASESDMALLKAASKRAKPSS